MFGAVLGIAYTMGKQALDDKKYNIAEYKEMRIFEELVTETYKGQPEKIEKLLVKVEDENIPPSVLKEKLERHEITL